MEIFSNNENLFIGVDFGYKDDLAVEIRCEILSDGSIAILSNNIIGRTSEISKEKRKEICKYYERICNKEKVE